MQRRSRVRRQFIMSLNWPNDLRPVRKAYRKQALKTHPDKLPAGLSEEEKSVSAEKFKEVCRPSNIYHGGDSSSPLQISHACEILTDPERRKVCHIYSTIQLHL